MPTNQIKHKIIFISWAPYCSRSDNMAREFNGKSYMVYSGFFGSNYYTILFKYIFQTIKTLLILFKDRPDIIFVMSPPVFANIPIYIYTRLFNKKFIIDGNPPKAGILEKRFFEDRQPLSFESAKIKKIETEYDFFKNHSYEGIVKIFRSPDHCNPLMMGSSSHGKNSCTIAF